MRLSNQPAIQAINRSTPCIPRKLFFAWVALGFYVHLQPSLHAQQVQLRGTVAVHNSKYETGEVIYVQNAYLSAPFTVPATSDVEGVFVLEFVGLDLGTPMKIEAEKAGLEVVNTRELEEVVIGRKFPLRIYVAEKGKLAQAKTELYQISREALFARRDALIARLRGEKAQSEAAVAELQKRFGQELSDRFAAEDLLRSKLEEQQKRLPSLAMELASKNLDNASQLYIQAYELFQQGEIGKVIALLDEEKLQASYAQVKEARARIEEEKALLAAREEQNHQQIQQLIATYTLKADALALEFRYAEVAAQYQAIIGIHLENELSKKDLAGWYDQLGEVLLNNGTYPRALEAFQKALAIREEVLDATHPDMAQSYNNIGGTYLNMGRYEQALVFQQKALAIREEVLDATHPDMAQSYNNIGLTYVRMGTYEQALEYYGKARAIQEQVFPPEHPELAGTYSNIGLVYWHLADYAQTLTYHGKALAIKEKVLPPEHPSLAVTYNDMGWLYIRLADYAQALEYFGKDRSIREEVLPPEHPGQAVTYNAIGVVYEQLADYEQGLAYHGKALAIREKVLPPKHPDLAMSYSNIGFTYSKMGNYEQALAFQQKALAIREAVLDAKHPSLAISYSTTAAALTGLQQYKAAQDYLQKALAIFKEIKHPRIITAYGRLGLVELKLGTTSKAKEYFSLYNELAKDKDKALGAYYQALYHTVIGDLQKALGFLEEAVAKGYQNKVHITQEELLAPLHKEARYQALVEKLQNKNH